MILRIIHRFAALTAVALIGTTGADIPPMSSNFQVASKNLIYSAETLTVIRVSTLGRAPIRYRRESLLANDYADRLPDTVFAGAACIPRHRHFLPGAIGGANRRQSTNRNRPRASKYGRRHDNGLTPN